MWYIQDKDERGQNLNPMFGKDVNPGIKKGREKAKKKELDIFLSKR